MKGLDIARGYYETYGREAIERECPSMVSRIAVGLAGDGSECFGYDDALSVDHDFEPAFCLWLTDEDYAEYGFRLERMYARLPDTYAGYTRQRLSPVGGSRHGVMRIADFYMRFLGSADAPSSLEQWLYLPTAALAAASNGEVFCDELGAFSAIRHTLLQGYPSDVRLKKLAAHLIMMQQTGLYNYDRCLRRGENGAAQLCVFEFVKHTISTVYLLNNRYEPFYKWAYRGMRSLPILGMLEGSLVALTELGNSGMEAEAKRESIEEIGRSIADAMKKEGLIDGVGDDLQRHALALQHRIKDPQLRNMHIMDGI